MTTLETKKHFLLVGNGPYTNRGCEAIVRGTMAILRNEFGENFRVTLGSFGPPLAISDQATNEIDPLITHIALSGQPLYRWSLAWWRNQLIRRLLPDSFDKTYAMLDVSCKDACCAMQVGGDNYSLDYGRPLGFMLLDAYLRRRGVPVVLWGASVGPFEADPSFALKMYAHLRAMRAVFLRESDSYEYLKQHGLDSNLYRMSDPAFVMAPVEPPQEKIGFELPADAVGLNLSPLMAKYVTGGDMDAWVKMGAEIVQCIVKTTGYKVLLIPHVTNVGGDDHALLRNVVDSCDNNSRNNIFCVGNKLSAAETKWVISHCAVFAGARTHSTIAALSSCVPTLSLAYSRKAMGLNQDILGNQDYCLQPTEITPACVAQHITDLLSSRHAISEHLAVVMLKVREHVMQSGTSLRHIMETR